ncbi:hypothetical protein RIF29_23986 [Crotalaria pallida]|uniref:Uncharacterized protein n=1 Tax=Crotalaria pallida TaxID=3830 RepID=A0AAN9EJN0_CROPI
MTQHYETIVCVVDSSSYLLSHSNNTTQHKTFIHSYTSLFIHPSSSLLIFQFYPSLRSVDSDLSLPEMIPPSGVP